MYSFCILTVMYYLVILQNIHGKKWCLVHGKINNQCLVIPWKQKDFLLQYSLSTLTEEIVKHLQQHTQYLLFTLDENCSCGGCYQVSAV